MIESLACGTPVVSFDVCSAREILVQYNCGRVVPQGDYAGLVRELATLARNTFLRNALGVHGSQTARELSIQRGLWDNTSICTEILQEKHTTNVSIPFMQKVSLTTPTKGQGLPQAESPFIAMTVGYRILIIGYVVLYNISIPGFQDILYNSSVPLVQWRFLISVIYEFLVFLPILYYRPNYGWLHPLVFPTVYGLAKSLASRPDQLLAPFLFTETSGRIIEHEALQGWSQESLAWAMLKGQLIAMIALVTYYLGFFFGPQLRIPHFKFLKPRNVAPKALTVIACSVVIFLVFMQFRGGLTAHLTSWGQGSRFEALEGFGIVIALIQCGMVASLIWFAFDRTASRNPLFWAAVLFSVPVNFFTGGSRSAVVYAGCMFLMIWIMRNRKIPQGKIAILGIATIVLLGLLGQLRRRGVIAPFPTQR